MADSRQTVRRWRRSSLGPPPLPPPVQCAGSGRRLKASSSAFRRPRRSKRSDRRCSRPCGRRCVRGSRAHCRPAWCGDSSAPRRSHRRSCRASRVVFPPLRSPGVQESLRDDSLLRGGSDGHENEDERERATSGVHGAPPIPRRSILMHGLERSNSSRKPKAKGTRVSASPFELAMAQTQ